MIDFSVYPEYKEGYEAAKARNEARTSNLYREKLIEYYKKQGVPAPEDMQNKDRAWEAGWWAYTDQMLTDAFDELMKDKK